MPIVISSSVSYGIRYGSRTWQTNAGKHRMLNIGEIRQDKEHKEEKISRQENFKNGIKKKKEAEAKRHVIHDICILC